MAIRAQRSAQSPAHGRCTGKMTLSPRFLVRCPTPQATQSISVQTTKHLLMHPTVHPSGPNLAQLDGAAYLTWSSRAAGTRSDFLLRGVTPLPPECANTLQTAALMSRYSFPRDAVKQHGLYFTLGVQFLSLFSSSAVVKIGAGYLAAERKSHSIPSPRLARSHPARGQVTRNGLTAFITAVS